MGLGFVLLTLGVIFAITWASIESGTRWLADPKILLSFFTWAALPADDFAARLRGLARDEKPR